MVKGGLALVKTLVERRLRWSCEVLSYRGLCLTRKPPARDEEKRNLRPSERGSSKVAEKSAVLRAYHELMDGWSRTGKVPKYQELYETLNGLGTHGLLSQIEEIGRRMKDCNVAADSKLYYTRIKALVYRRRDSELLPTYEQMLQENVAPSVFVYSLIISALAKSRRTSELDYMVQEMTSHGFVPDAALYNALLDAYSRQMNVEAAHSWFVRMLDAKVLPDVRTFTILARLYARKHCGDEVFRILEEMKRYHLEPNVVTYGSVIDGFAQNARADLAEKAFTLMVDDRVVPNVIVLNSLLKAHVNSGDIPGALNTYKMFQGYGCRPTVVTFCSILGVLSTQQDAKFVKLAEAFFGKMISSGITPDIMAYTCLMNVYNRSGMVAETEATFRTMQRSIPKYDGLAYKPIIQVHSRVGDSQRAIEYLMEARQLGLDNIKKTFRDMIKNFLKRGDREAIAELLRIGGEAAEESLEDVKQGSEPLT